MDDVDSVGMRPLLSPELRRLRDEHRIEMPGPAVEGTLVYHLVAGTNDRVYEQTQLHTPTA
eukprot:CAMPEP_0194370570 /NCGR_PEP_ID=MMETSP0174-20130528/18881_1 /TAXON_ID=216777 /ORGANISM="Proboscia alata, Strain PI-D3" /LENGTH=60 /DNA_ID=CAMNT_0039148109 /DNA_START=42 /DNA_END=224 /DNA_ORIENTATION=+